MNGQRPRRVREGGYPANSDGAANAGRHGEWHAEMKYKIAACTAPVARTPFHDAPGPPGSLGDRDPALCRHGAETSCRLAIPGVHSSACSTGVDARQRSSASRRTLANAPRCAASHDVPRLTRPRASGDPLPSEPRQTRVPAALAYAAPVRGEKGSPGTSLASPISRQQRGRLNTRRDGPRGRECARLPR